jgi:hypothetical protein
MECVLRIANNDLIIVDSSTGSAILLPDVHDRFCRCDGSSSEQKVLYSLVYASYLLSC